MIKQFFSFIIIIFLLSAPAKCLFAGNLKKHVFEKEKFSVSLPDDWEIKEIHANHVVALVNKPPETEFDNFSENILITAGYTEENPPTLEQSLEILLKQITYLYGESCIYDSGTEQLGDKKVIWVLYGEKDGDLGRKNINYIFVNGNYQYMLWCYSLEDTFDQYESLFDSIAKSLTFSE